MLEKTAIYILTLLIHVFWLKYAIRTKKIFKFPIVFSCFLGLFIFNACGSILIMYSEKWGFAKQNYFSYDYILMLNLQIIIFYILTEIYFYLSFQKNNPVKKNKFNRINDNYFLYFLLIIVGLFSIFLLYISGSPPLLKIITGSLESYNEIISYRTQFIHSGSSTLANLGFKILPMFASAYLFLKGSVRNKRLWYEYFFMGILILVSCLQGGKGNVLYIGITLFFAYIITPQNNNILSRKTIFNTSIFLWFCAAFIPVLLFYNTYYQSYPLKLNTFDKIKLLIYRIFGVYSESIAATVKYTEKYGFLGGNTLPNIRGILSHEPINTSKEISRFIYGSNAVGNTPISALAEGYINFGWSGFILFSIVTFATVILFQELFRYMPINLFTLSLKTVYCVLAVQISQTSLFATFISFTYIPFFLFLFLVRCILNSICLRKKLVH